MKFRNLLLLGLIVSLLVSCGEKITDENEDDTPDPEPQETYYRLYEVLEGYGEMQSKTTLEYEDNNLIKIVYWLNEAKEWKKESAFEVTYSADEIVFSGYEYDNDESYLYEVIKYTLDNENIVQESYFEVNGEELNEDIRTSFEYDSEGKITEVRFYDFYDEISISDSLEIIYNDNKINEILAYHVDDIDINSQNKFVYEYSGNNITQITNYEIVDNNNYASEKFEYQYNSDNQISTITEKIYSDGLEDWLTMSDETFEYDDNGYLIEKNFETENYKYSYEEGQGNACIIYRSPEELLMFNPTPKDGEKKFSIRPLYERLNIKK